MKPKVGLGVPPGGPPIAYNPNRNYEYQASNDLNQLSSKSIEFSLQLMSYSNPQRLMSNGFKCFVDNDSAPVIGTDGRKRRKRYTNSEPKECSFTVVAQFGGERTQPASMTSTQPIRLGKNSTKVKLSHEPTRTFAFDFRPVALSITILHTGILRYSNAEIWHYGDGPWVAKVDTFYLNLSDFDGINCADNGLRTVDLFGMDVGSVLQIKLCHTCTNKHMGEHCDLLCDFDTPNAGAPPFVCKSILNGYSAVCEYGDPNGVRGCTTCEFGIKTVDEKPTCKTADDFVGKNQNHYMLTIMNYIESDNYTKS